MPATNISSIVLSQYLFADSPDVVQISRCTILSGCTNFVEGFSRCSKSIMSLNIGPAPVIPETWFIGLLSKLPTQIPIRYLSVKPIHQLSLKSFEVPVFAEQKKGRFKGLYSVNAGLRALLSDRISVIMYAISGVKILFGLRFCIHLVESMLIKECSFL